MKNIEMNEHIGKVCQKYRLKNKLTSGDIILMHNGTEHTADSLDMIIKNIKICINMTFL